MAAKPKRKPTAATEPVAPMWPRETLYLNMPRDLVARIRARVAELGYPHTLTSVATAALLAQFPPPATAAEQEKAS